MPSLLLSLVRALSLEIGYSNITIIPSLMLWARGQLPNSTQVDKLVHVHVHVVDYASL